MSLNRRRVDGPTLCVDDMLFISGMVSRANDGTTIEGRDEDEQAKVICGKIRSLVKAAGGAMADVVKVTIYWRARRILYLKQAVQCNLSKASRILRILRFHAFDLNLEPATVYKEKPPAVKCRYDFRNRARKISRRLTRGILSGWGHLAFVMRDAGIRTMPTRKSES